MLQFFCFFAAEMKKRFIHRLGIVFFLLLVLFQQVGAGLYIHNQLHNSEKQAHGQHHESSQEIKFGCSCVDHFLTPVITAEPIVIVVPEKPLETSFASCLIEKYFTSIVSPSLRGPPVFIA